MFSYPVRWHFTCSTHKLAIIFVFARGWGGVRPRRLLCSGRRPRVRLATCSVLVRVEVELLLLLPNLICSDPRDRHYQVYDIPGTYSSETIVVRTEYCSRWTRIRRVRCNNQKHEKSVQQVQHLPVHAFIPPKYVPYPAICALFPTASSTHVTDAKASKQENNQQSTAAVAAVPTTYYIRESIDTPCCVRDECITDPTLTLHANQGNP